MPYCADCGTKVKEESQFCPECGTSLETANTAEGTVSEETATTANSTDDLEKGGFDTGRGIAAGVMGITVGAIVAFAFSNFGGSLFFFIITVVGVGYFLYSREESTKLVVGMGLYITALWLPLSPIMFYIPLAGQAETGTAAGTGAVVGSVFGMAIYGFIGLIIGLASAVVGYFIRRGELND